MNARTVREKTKGATIMFLFGAIWLLLGFYGGRPSPISLRFGFLLVGMSLAAGIGIIMMRSTRQSSSAALPSAEKAAVSEKKGRRFAAEQMEIARLRAELARVTMERDILGKATAYFAKGQK